MREQPSGLAFGPGVQSYPIRFPARASDFHKVASLAAKEAPGGAILAVEEAPVGAGAHILYF